VGVHLAMPASLRDTEREYVHTEPIPTQSKVGWIVAAFAALACAVIVIASQAAGASDSSSSPVPPTPRPPSIMGCHQTYDGVTWGEPTADPGQDIAACRKYADVRLPGPQPLPGGDWLRTPDGRVRMFLSVVVPPQGFSAAAQAALAPATPAVQALLNSPDITIRMTAQAAEDLRNHRTIEVAPLPSGVVPTP
jgi:hypothetical protein